MGEKGAVVAFEPFAASFDKLQRNIALNSFDNIKAEYMAVSDSPGTLELYPGDKTIRATTVADMANEQAATTVDATSIDQYVYEGGERPDLVKINAEGIEYNVFDGMSSTMNECRPTIIAGIHPHGLV